MGYYINLIPHVRDDDVQIQTDGLCPFENESPTGNLKKTDAGLHGYNGLKIRSTSENLRLKTSLTC